MRIAEALRLLRTSRGLTQYAAAKRKGSPNFRTLSHWETRRRVPSLKMLGGYLDSQGLDFHDLQDALDQVNGVIPKRVANALSGVEQRLESIERHLRLLESRQVESEGGSLAPASEAWGEAAEPEAHAASSE